jgi:hypothetical protein
MSKKADLNALCKYKPISQQTKQEEDNLHQKSETNSENSSTLTVNEFLKIFTVLSVVISALLTQNLLLLALAIGVMAFVLAGPTPSTFKEVLSIVRESLKKFQRNL